MPNRKAVIEVLVQDVLGVQRWNGLRGETVNMPTEDWDRTEEAATAILERIAGAVNWSRLLMEAHWRHTQLHEDREAPKRWTPTAAGVCGECLREALLSEERGAPDWERHPSRPLVHEKTDWPSVIADTLKHREVAFWHPYKG